MTIKLIVLGKTDGIQLNQLIDEYRNRLKHYIKFQIETIPDIRSNKNLSEKQQKEKEGEVILNRIAPTDVLILLDENGKQHTSVEFSGYLQKKMNSGLKQLVFVVGGPYGFSEAVYQKCQGKISLS